PAASGRRFRASHPIRSVPATTHGTRPDHGPCGSTHSEQCDRRNRSYRPANPDRECSARPSWTARYRHPTPASNCPAGATLSQPGLRKSVAMLDQVREAALGTAEIADAEPQEERNDDEAE